MNTSRIIRIIAGAAVLAALVAAPASPALASGASAAAATGAQAQAADPEPDYSGLRLKAPGQDAVYLIDPEGYRRWIPNAATYNNLFADWNGIITDRVVNRISEREALSDGALLARRDGGEKVYLISNGVKRWIEDPHVFDRYHFDWNQIHSFPSVIIDSIPTGRNWY